MAEPMSVPVISQQRETVGEMTLSEKVFCGPVRAHLLYEVVRMQQANRRSGTAATKTRAAVRGGGAKPWRQKGTGRARAGSIRSPIWVGGATIFGPQPRDYSYRMPASARKAALCAAFAAKVRDGKLVVVDKLTLGATEPPTEEQQAVDRCRRPSHGACAPVSGLLRQNKKGRWIRS